MSNIPSASKILSFAFSIEAPAFAHEIRGKLGELSKHVTHATSGRTNSQLITVALDDEFDVLGAIGEFSRDTHRLGIAIFR